jgi:hypothetical protein
MADGALGARTKLHVGMGAAGSGSPEGKAVGGAILSAVLEAPGASAAPVVELSGVTAAEATTFVSRGLAAVNSQPGGTRRETPQEANVEGFAGGALVVAGLGFAEERRLC